MNFLLTFNKSIPLFSLDATLAKANRVCSFGTLVPLMAIATNRQGLSLQGSVSFTSLMPCLHLSITTIERVRERQREMIESVLKIGQNVAAKFK